MSGRRRCSAMNRRDFLAMTFASVFVPIAHAQSPARIHRVGWLDFSSAAENLGIFEQAMIALGWIDGKTFKIDYRGGEGTMERLATAATELVRVPVDVIVAPGTPEAVAAKKATSSIPIVFSGVDDPVEKGLVTSLARPGVNVTGLANAGKELNGKLLSLLREIVPRATSVAVLWDATEPGNRVILGQIQSSANALGVSVNSVQVQRYTEVEPAFATIRKQGSQMLIVPPSSMLVPRWIADLALKNGLPLASTSAGYAYEGGLLAYADDWKEVFNRVAALVDKILKGSKAADLLSLTIPPSIMVRADSVIQ